MSNDQISVAIFIRRYF